MTQPINGARVREWRTIGLVMGFQFLTYLGGLLLAINYFISPVESVVKESKEEIAIMRGTVYTNVANYSGITVELRAQSKALDELKEDVTYIRRKVEGHESTN